jgi:hypothetical protein
MTTALRWLLTMLCGFTVLGSAWLFVMYLVLRHPGFEWRAGAAIGYLTIGLVTLVALRSPHPPRALRALALAGGGMLAAVGVWVLRTNVDEGFADVFGFAFALQGALAISVFLRAAAWRPPVSSTAPSSPA